MKRIYISGPMTGFPNHNFPAFHAAAQQWREAGWEVANPAENFSGRTDLPRETYIRADVAMLAQCDAIAVLPGWERSRGAQLEYLLARELGMMIMDATTLQTLENTPVPGVVLYWLKLAENDTGVPAECILDEAKRITGGTRQNDYGHPSQDFRKTAQMWTAILSGKLGAESVSEMDVALCMIAVKLARQSHRHKRDNLVDIAGYARTAAMVAGDE